jgi:tRNA(Ile)-lysidine synthase
MSRQTVLAAVLAALREVPEDLRPPKVAVACSGGLDSMVLLRAMIEARELGLVSSLSALHVNHGLHPQADLWQRQVESFCQRFDVVFRTASVGLDASGGNIEARAREARYTALVALSNPEEVICLAHHAQDQVETILLRWLRGAGASGLSGMARWSSRRGRHLARPLLSLNKETLKAAADDWNLPRVEDPSNDDITFERNYLRHRVLPLLRQRWPALDRSVAASSALLGEQASLLEEIAGEDLDKCSERGSLLLSVLRGLSPQRQSNLLACWLRKHGREVPSRRWLQTTVAELAQLAPDNHWRKDVAGIQLLVGQGRLYLMPDNWKQVWEAAWSREPPPLWRGESSVSVGARVEVEGEPGLPSAWVLRPLIALEDGPRRLQTAPGGPHKSLKKVFQEHAVPWLFRPFWPCASGHGGHLLLGLGWSGSWDKPVLEAGMRSGVVWLSEFGELERFEKR